MLSYIVIALVVIGLVGYFRSLSKEDRATQAALLRDGVAVAGSATAKVAKESIKVAYSSGKAVSGYVLGSTKCYEVLILLPLLCSCRLTVLNLIRSIR